MVISRKRWVYLLSTLLATFLVAAVHGSPATADVTITVKPYITWIEQTRATIQWQTDQPATSTIQFGATNSYGQAISSGDMTVNHKVVVNNLSKNTLYHYRASSTANNTTIYSSPYTFQTAVDRSTPFRFAFMGDTHTYGTNIYSPQVTKVANAIQARNPNLVISSGDLIRGNSAKTRSATEQQYRDELFGTSCELMARTPYMLAIGDHDRRGAAGDKVFATYFDGHESPYWGKSYYSFTYGNARFIMVDSIITADHADGVEVPGIAKGSDQYKWLVDTLDKNTSDWTFLVYHYATYHSHPRFQERDGEMRALVAPLCDKYGVDMVMAGHAHLYERTHPIKNGVIDPDGTIYITAGIGGGSSDMESPGGPFTAAMFGKTDGYGIIDINGGDLTYRVCDLDGNVKDRLSLQKAVSNGE